MRIQVALLYRTLIFSGLLRMLRGLPKALKKGILVICVSNPFSLSLLKAPASLGADIVCGEAQPLGTPVSYGGPGCGFLAATQKHLRQIPGRIVGRTTDREGNTGYCLTLQTREQHIRREKATSNICSNESLNVLSAAVYLSLFGKEGMKKNALYSLNLAHYLFERLHEVEGVQFPFSARFFNEFVWGIKDASVLMKKLLRRKCIAGLNLGKFYPLLKDNVLSCCTEIKTRDQIDEFIEEIKKLINGKTNF